MPQLTYLIIININGGRIRPDFFLNDPGKWRERNQQQKNLIDSNSLFSCTCYWISSDKKFYTQSMVKHLDEYYISYREHRGQSSINHSYWN